MQEDQTLSIRIGQMAEALPAQVCRGGEALDTVITGVFASDLMSDVLAYGKPNSVLLTGLCAKQAVISAFMADFSAVVFLRSKKPDMDLLKFAEEKGIVILSTSIDMFEACVRVASLFGNALAHGDILVSSKPEKNVTTHDFTIDGKDFASSGILSTQIKSILKDIGFDAQLVRRVAISTYEGEMNVVMHALRARVTLAASDQEIVVVIDDEGKGIPDIDLAMQEGFSTATEEQRALGFGAGMGLPNMKRNADMLNVSSAIGRGTRVEMRFFVGNGP